MNFLQPDWLGFAAIDEQVGALCTTRTGGVSHGEYGSLNLGAHVGDEPANVAENRRRLIELAGLPSEPLWLNQVHGSKVLAASDYKVGAGVGNGAAGNVELATSTGNDADAIVCTEPGQVGAIMTADCLPVLFAAQDASVVAAAHAGWRSLEGGILQNTLAAMRVAPSHVVAWLGPAISQAAFEVGDEVREQFVAKDAGNAACFTPNGRGRWQADLYSLARRALQAAGVHYISGGDYCTHRQADQFFSHRRAAPCGRMASLIWIRPSA